MLSNPSACQLGLVIDDDSCPEDSPAFQPNIFSIQVTDAPGTALGEDVYLKEVRLIIAHDWLNDLDIYLESPGGHRIELSSDNGGGENNLGQPEDTDCDSAVVFSYNACLSIEEAVPPYLGSRVLAEQPFYHFNDSVTNPNGLWNLIICDDVEEDAGTLEFVHLVFEPIQCLPVQEVASIEVDSTTAVVAMQPDDFCGITIFEYGPPGFSPGQDSTAGPGGNTIIMDGCPPFILGNLPELSQLDLYIRRYCPAGGTFSDNTCGNTLETGCRPPPITMETTFGDEQTCPTFCGVECPLTGWWRNAPNADFDWIVHNGPAPTQGTGPQSDANGDGNYVYLESSGSSCPTGGEARLLSACVQLNKAGSDTCHFSFNYHMFGNSTGLLRLEVSRDGGFNWQSIWQRSGDQGNQWHKEYVSLAEFPDGSSLQLRFSGTKGPGFRGDIALDHLVFYGSVPMAYPENPFYTDMDGDGYGSGSDFILSCLSEAPSGYAAGNMDCNDNNPEVHPGMAEIPCNGIDDNCNGNDDDLFLPSPQGTNDTICSGETPELCAVAGEGFLTAWYNSPELTVPVFIGPCFSPDLPPNRTPNTEVYRFYAVETNFSCYSASPTVLEIHIRPQPKLILEDQPPICPGDTFNLDALNIIDENFTNGLLSLHSGSPASADNLLAETEFIASEDTLFFARMASVQGCSDEIALPLTITQGPELTFSPSDSFILCKESVTAVEVQAGSGDYEYFWSNGRSGPTINISAGSKSGDQRSYQVTVTDGNGCTSAGSVVVQTSNSIDSLFRKVTNAISCQGAEGSIALVPLTGLPPFSYQWTGSNGVTGSATSDQDTFVISDLKQGAYRITITDSSSEECAFRLRNVLVQGPGAEVTSTQITPVSCYGAADGKIELGVIGNNPVFSWSNGSTTASADQLAAGTYSVTITDGSCETILSELEVGEPETLEFRANTVDASCGESSDGSLEINIFGGDGNYTLQWENGNNNRVRNDLFAGAYPFTITDGNGCSLADSARIGAPDSIIIVLDSIRHLTCFEAGDGYLQAGVSGGNPPYQYSWNTGSTISALFDLPAGAYALTIIDFNGCQATKSFEISQPDLLTAQLIDREAPLCEGVADGAVEVGASGGTAPFSFSWSDGGAQANRSDLPVGHYEVTVTDQNGCRSAPLPVPLGPVEIINPGISTVLPACAGPATGSITLNPTGTAPFQATWSNGDTGLQLSGISTGAYGLTLTDDRGCRLDSLITLEAPQVFQLNLTAEPPTCFGVNDGIAQVVFKETGTPPYQFAWSDGATDRNRFDLATGDYQLTVSDNLGCQFISDTITLMEPEPFRISAYDTGQVNCSGAATGFIEVELTGGTQPYAINWIGQGVELPGIYAIPSGDYRLQVFDANNCPVDTTFKITQPPPIDLEVAILPGDPCDTRLKDTLVAMAGGGIPPYFYLWNNGMQGPEIRDAAPGDYTVTVTDAYGCQDVVRSIKLRPRDAALKLDTFYVKDISCFGAADAAMTARVSGGSGRYSYLFRPAHLFENTTEDSITVSGLALHNQYAVTVTDAKTGCRIASQPLTAREPPPLSTSLEQINGIKCFGEMTGSMDVKISGGILPYQYRWTDRKGDLVGEAEDLMNVGAGTYQLLVTDANACTLHYSDSIAPLNQEIILSDTMVQPVSCFEQNSGGIDITITGGKPPYSYLWNDGSTTEDLTGIPVGLYTLALTDADNCSVLFSDLEVTQQDDLLEAETVTTPVSCFGAKDGAVRVMISGGAPPYHFAWSKNGQPIPEASEAQLNDISAGIYSVEFSDSQGCSKTFETEVTGPSDIVVRLQVNLPQPPDYDNGSAQVTVSGGLPDYSYFWSTGDTTSNISELTSGTYRLTVTDSNNCQDSISLTLTDYIDLENVRSARLFPNPTHGRFFLELDLAGAIAAHLNISDALGRPIFQQELPRQEYQKIPIDTHRWPAGIYWVKLLYQGRIVYADRIVVIH